MKRIIAIFLSLAILSGLCLTASAVSEGDYYDVQVRGDNYYLLGEEFPLDVQINNGDDVELLKLYITCNKDVVKYNGSRDLGSTVNTQFVIDESPDGYVITYTCVPDALGCVYNFAVSCYFEIAGSQSPDFSFRCEKKLFGKDMKSASVWAFMPPDEVFEKEDIPHIVTNLKPPVFGERTGFTAYGRLYLYAPQTVDEIMSMLSSSDGVSEIKFVPCNDLERDYVTTNDAFVLEYAGRKCDEVYITLRGDADGDGLISAADARLALRYSASLDTLIPLSAEVTNDGKITSADARQILRVAAKLDIFRHKDVTVWVNQTYKVGPLRSEAGIMYMWECVVSDPEGIEVTVKTESSVDNTGKPPEEIVVGAPSLQTFTLKVKKTGTYDVRFRLVCPWMNDVRAEFGFRVVADDVLC